ncbi:SWI SNF, matrix associated, actin dependent regulator of chromatin, sub d, member 2 [Sparganum proliferum]
MSFQHAPRPPFSPVRGPTAPGAQPMNAHANQNSPQMSGRRLLPIDSRLHQIASRNPLTKKKRRLADRLLTKTVRQIIPESESYMELLEVEKKLDLVLSRKRLTLQESLKQPAKAC